MIERIYVINLDRKPQRWEQIKKELKRINIEGKATLFELTRRFSAVDARYLDKKIDENFLIPKYSLYDQLIVEPNSKVTSDIDTREFMIDMTPQEIAVTLSHIEIWKLIASADKNYTLILEDDVYFKINFSKEIDDIWCELHNKNEHFDILFLSYEYVKSDEEIQIERITKAKVKKPSKGIWQASGYVLSKRGAQKLLSLLPVFGPVDLWLNLVFDKLDVFIVEKQIIIQRIDVPSTNSYSIMPIFSKLGLYTGNDQSIFIKPKLKYPVLVFGSPNSGLTSVANALMILGYTCCYNHDNLPNFEERKFWSKKEKNYFNAYVNIKSLEKIEINKILHMYPDAKIIYISDDANTKIDDSNTNCLNVFKDYSDKWELLCQFLDLEYPAIPFPEIDDSDMVEFTFKDREIFNAKELEFDDLPWIIRSKDQFGMGIDRGERIYDNFLLLDENTKYDLQSWKLRDDTFPSNLAIFDPKNVTNWDSVIELNFKKETTSIRDYSSAAIVTKEKYLYGKFKVELRPSNVSGLITGIFLHRNSPHQEIDIEFLGKDTTKMLINVFFNPGIEGSKLEYGYRGTPVIVELGFDASEKYHMYEIHWEKDRIRWIVDGVVVYERIMYLPTPIPYLPMEFNINLWHSRSEELSGKLEYEKIPARTTIKKIEINF